MSYPCIDIDDTGLPYPASQPTEHMPLWPTAFIEWLEPRLTKDMNVFEWGMGNGSLWLARRVATLHSVEHHRHWADAIQAIQPANQTVTIVPLSKILDYSNAIHRANDQYDIIIVDSMRRDDCLIAAITHLKPHGLLILDNSDSEAHATQALLKDSGWHSKTLTGRYAWSDTTPHDTRVFSREPIQ